MRIECIFQPATIPLSYQYLFSSLIKNAISTSSEEKFVEVYYYGDKKTKQSKSFTFSVFMRNFEIAGECFEVKDEIRCIISSPEAELILHIYNGLLTAKEFQHKNYRLSLKRINLMKEQLPTKSEALFKTLSPIAIKSKKGEFIAPNHEEYDEALNYISNEIIKNIRESGLKEKLAFVPLQMKKQVVKQQHESFEALNENKTLYVEAYRGTFKLKGNAEDLALLTQTGLGFRRSQGFGNIQLVDG